MQKIIINAFAKLISSETFWLGMVIVNWLFLSSKTDGNNIASVLMILAPAIFAYKGFKKHSEAKND